MLSVASLVALIKYLRIQGSTFLNGLERLLTPTWNPEPLQRLKGFSGLAFVALHQPRLILNYLSHPTEVFLLFLLSITGQSLLCSLFLTQHGIFSSVFKLLRNPQCQSLRCRYKKIFLAPSHRFPRSLNCFSLHPTLYFK